MRICIQIIYNLLLEAKLFIIFEAPSYLFEVKFVSATLPPSLYSQANFSYHISYNPSSDIGVLLLLVPCICIFAMLNFL